MHSMSLMAPTVVVISNSFWYRLVRKYSTGSAMPVGEKPMTPPARNAVLTDALQPAGPSWHAAMV